MVISNFNEDINIKSLKELIVGNKSSTKKNTLPIDVNELGKDEIFLCFNTHPTNIGIGFSQAALLNTLLTVAFGGGILAGLKWGLIFSGIFNAPALAEQIFARDFMLTKPKIGKECFSDDFEGMSIRTVQDGKVVAADKMRGPYGNVVMIQHDNYLYSAYGHLATKGILVKKNQKVKKGQRIGIGGNTGNSSAPHCHFELLYTNPDNPIVIGHPLTNFENHKVIPLEYSDIYSNKHQNLNFIFQRIKKEGWKTNSTGEILSFCAIGK